MCFPRHLRDIRKALRHRKAGTMLYNHWCGESERVLMLRGQGSLHLSESHVNHMLAGQVSWEGRRLSVSSQSCLNTKQHLPSHTAVCAIRKLWEQESSGSEVGWRAAGRRHLGAAESQIQMQEQEATCSLCRPCPLPRGHYHM